MLIISDLSLCIPRQTSSYGDCISLRSCRVPIILPLSPYPLPISTDQSHEEIHPPGGSREGGGDHDKSKHHTPQKDAYISSTTFTSQLQISIIVLCMFGGGTGVVDKFG